MRVTERPNAGSVSEAPYVPSVSLGHSFLLDRCPPRSALADVSGPPLFSLMLVHCLRPASLLAKSPALETTFPPPHNYLGDAADRPLGLRAGPSFWCHVFSMPTCHRDGKMEAGIRKLLTPDCVCNRYLKSICPPEFCIVLSH